MLGWNKPEIHSRPDFGISDYITTIIVTKNILKYQFNLFKYSKLFYYSNTNFFFYMWLQLFWKTINPNANHIFHRPIYLSNIVSPNCDTNLSSSNFMNQILPELLLMPSIYEYRGTQQKNRQNNMNFYIRTKNWTTLPESIWKRNSAVNYFRLVIT